MILYSDAASYGLKITLYTFSFMGRSFDLGCIGVTSWRAPHESSLTRGVKVVTAS